MRICLLTTSYPEHAEDPSGHFVRAEALQLAQQGHEVHVLAPRSQAVPNFDDQEVHCWRLLHGGALGWPGALSRLRAHPWRASGAAAFMALALERLRKLQPERIVAHWLVPAGYPIGVHACPKAELEVVSHGSDVRVLLALPKPLRVHVVETLLERACKVRVVAHCTATALASGLPSGLRERWLARATIGCAPMLVDEVADRAQALRKQCEAPVLAVAVGRLLASKRLELAVQSANLLGPQVQLHVIGDGPEAERLQSQDRVGNVHFRGRLQRSEALAWIAASDVLVHPSAAEGAPTVVREARLLGTPVVACDAGDILRWAEHDPGIMVVEPKAGAIASGIGRLVSDSQDPHF